MKKLLLAFFLSIFCFSSAAISEQVTLTTYYPAPTGRYVDFWVTGTATINNLIVTTLTLTNLTVTGTLTAGTISAGTITATGNISSSAAFLYTSDARLKDQVSPITDALLKVDQLTGVNYVLKSDPGQKRIGVIAQEIEPVVPEVVRTGADGMKSVDYASLTALLIQGMKEQQAQIRALQTRIDALEASK